MSDRKPSVREFKKEELLAKHEEFRRKEGRASFYDFAMEIADKHPLQAAIIILATWNARRFRFVVNDPRNLMKLKDAVRKCGRLFGNLREKSLQTVDFDEIGEIVNKIYSSLSSIKGVEYTGASKVMHLFCPNLIVMWDGYIRAEYKRHYIICDGSSPKDFLSFQKLMQRLCKNVRWNDSSKTLAKAIDEYNYVTITLPKLKGRD